LLAVDMGGESGGGGSEGGEGGDSESGSGDAETSEGGSGGDSESQSQPQVDNDPGQVLDPTKNTGFVPAEPQNQIPNTNPNENDNKDNNESPLEKCRGDGFFDGHNVVLNNARLRECNESNGNSGVGAYTGGWMSGCLKNHGTVKGLELCSQTLAKVLGGMEILVDNER
jgi:hypothetical protein